MRVALLVLVLICGAGCSTVQSSGVVRSPDLHLQAIKIEHFDSQAPDFARGVQEAFTAQILKSGKLRIVNTKPDAVVTGSVALSTASGFIVSGGSWGVTSAGSNGTYITNASIKLSTPAGELIALVNFGQNRDSLMWEGESSALAIGQRLAKKLLLDLKLE